MILRSDDPVPVTGLGIAWSLVEFRRTGEISFDVRCILQRRMHGVDGFCPALPGAGWVGLGGSDGMASAPLPPTQQKAARLWVG